MNAIFFSTRPPALLSAVCTLALSACMSYGPGRLATGASLDDTTKAMGQPTANYPLADGTRRVEYARGPYGKHTYLLYFDAQGRLQKWDQVLTEKRFGEVRSGIGSADVLAQIGHPSEVFSVGVFERQTVWAYRYDSMFCQWFMVGLNPQGTVIDTSYGPDPICESKEERVGI